MAQGQIPLGPIISSHPLDGGHLDHQGIPPRHISTAPVSRPTNDGDEDEETSSWSLMDALYPELQQDLDDQGEVDIFEILDGKAFGGKLSLDPIFEESSSWEQVETPHFPDLNEKLGESSKRGRTSEPVRPLEESREDREVMDLVNIERFQSFVSTPIGMIRFKQWVEEEGLPGSKETLRYYQDATAYLELVKEMKAVAEGMDTVYFGKRAVESNRPSGPRDCLSALSSTSLAMQGTLDDTSRRLYATEFKRFIAGNITEHARNRLGMSIDSAERGNLGAVFCLADPRLPDQPLVYVSDQFCALTEYPRSRILGRNCRFLQGPSTDRDAVQLVRGKEHCSLILNYTRTGKPFWNLLHMIPLRGRTGDIEYFLGAQINVTRALTSPEAFNALTTLQQKNWMNQTGQHDAISFSHSVLAAAETSLKRPVALRQLSPTQSYRPPLSPYPPTPSTSDERLAFETGDVHSHTPRGRFKRLMSFAPPRMEEAMQMESFLTDGSRPVETSQPVPPALREHMASFSSTYSKLLVLDSSSSRVSFITPPLLAHLGYSVKTRSDRFTPPVKGLDLLDLIAGSSREETHSTRMIIRDVLSKNATHSLFAGLYRSNNRVRWEGSETTEPIGKSTTLDGRSYVQVLLHLTPMAGIDGDTRYVVIVG